MHQLFTTKSFDGILSEPNVLGVRSTELLLKLCDTLSHALLTHFSMILLVVNALIRQVPGLTGKLLFVQPQAMCL